MNLFNRTINVSVNSLDEDRAVVQGVFIDSYHELVLSMTVSLNHFKVLDAEGELRRAPQQDCKLTGKRIKELIGMDLTHDVRKQIIRAVGGENGCTHFVEIALECVKGIKQAKFYTMGFKMSPEDVDAEISKQLKGTCFHFQDPEKADEGQAAR